MEKLDSGGKPTSNANMLRNALKKMETNKVVD